MFTKFTIARALGACAMTAGVLSTAAGASAGTASAPFQVTASVLNMCTISATALKFTNYDPTAGSPNLAQSALTLACTLGSTPAVTLDAGKNVSSKVRTMIDGTSGDPALAYNLYQPTATGTGATCSTTLWGDGNTTSGVAYSPAGPQLPTGQTLVVCGSLPINQSVKAGTTYVDTVTATVTF